MDSVLTNKDFLVGGKLTVSDLSFVPWNIAAVTRLLGAEFDFEKEYSNAAKRVCFNPLKAQFLNHFLYSWHQKLTQRESVKKVKAIKESLA